MLLHFYASVQTLLRCGYEHSSSKASNEAIPKPYQWSGQAEQEADQIESRNKILQALFAQCVQLALAEMGNENRSRAAALAVFPTAFGRSKAVPPEVGTSNLLDNVS